MLERLGRGRYRLPMRVAVVGAGHVGVVTAAAMAEIGHDVVCMDLDGSRIGLLQAGKTPFFELGLDDLLERRSSDGRLAFTTSLPDAVADAQVVFICVGRPATPAGDRSLTAVEAVAREVAQHASDGVVVAEKSTVPPGTADRLRLTLTRERPSLAFSVVSNPEFLREGHAVDDSLHPDRIVVGSDDARGFELMREVYRPLTDAGHPMIETDVRTAELAKLASNAFLAMKVSFSNQLAHLAELSEADALRVADVMGADPRIGPAFLRAGLGYGGYCLPKDVTALERFAERAGMEFGLLRETSRANEAAVDRAARKVEEAIWNLESKRIALLGLAFKPGTDDVRAAPALALARRFLAEGAEVVGHDPMAGAAAKAEVPELRIANDPYEAAAGAHCLVVCTEWPDYEGLEPGRLAQVMAYKVVVDGRNVFDPDAFGSSGFTYLPIGRPPVTPDRDPAEPDGGRSGTA
jgi:UDPglucose 6-dehydrogenase